MNQGQVLQQLLSWETAVKKHIETVADIRRTLGTDPEGPLETLLENNIRHLTEAVSMLVGDRENWLLYYMEDCGMGERPLEVTPLLNGGDGIRLISTAALAKVIYLQNLQPLDQ